MLIWHKELWLIDHGASFIFIILGPIGKSMPKVRLPYQRPRIVAASFMLQETDTAKQLLTRSVEAIVNLIPEEWLLGRGRRHGSGIEMYTSIL
jgi:hypothetical protein